MLSADISLVRPISSDSQLNLLHQKSITLQLCVQKKLDESGGDL